MIGRSKTSSTTAGNMRLARYASVVVVGIVLHLVATAALNTGNMREVTGDSMEHLLSVARFVSSSHRSCALAAAARQLLIVLLLRAGSMQLAEWMLFTCVCPPVPITFRHSRS
jgi:hypothetical protein